MPAEASPAEVSPAGPRTGAVAATVFAAAAQARMVGQPVFIEVLTDQQLVALAATASSVAEGPPLVDRRPLAGLAFAVKDNIDVLGVPTTAANPARSHAAAGSATVVRQLIAAGAMPIAKANLDQYATGLVGTRSPYGVCPSVFSAEHVSGGSSSGSAIAVAIGVVPFALGTDTAGSGRVPAAFNELVGLKPTKGLVSTSGVVPACRSLDCVTVFTGTVALARELFDVIAVFDPEDPYSRPWPIAADGSPPTGLARGRRPVVGVPDLDLELDPLHEKAWRDALAHAGAQFTLVTFDVEPFLEAAQLLYSGPWLAERTAAFGAELQATGPDEAGIDPIVRAVVSAGAELSAVAAFRGMHRLAELKRATDPVWALMDAILLPVTPSHPRLAEVAAEPVAVNAQLGRFTNMTNLLDLAALAVPGPRREDGLPFGVQFLGPAFSDRVLLDLGSIWTGESLPAGPTVSAPGDGRVSVAVAGAHLSGQPLNADLVRRGGELLATTRTAPDYRMYEVPGPVRRPGLTRLPTADSPLAGPPGRAPTSSAGDGGIEVEVWSLPTAALAGFIQTIAPPLAIGPLTLADGSQVLGFVCTADGVDPDREITRYGSWRGYLAAL